VDTTQELVRQQRKATMQSNKEIRKEKRRNQSQKKKGEDTEFEEIPIAMTDPNVRARTLAIAQKMLDPKARREILDASVNRYVFNDDERIVVEDDVELAENFVIRHYAQPTRTGAASSAYEPEVALIDFCFRWIHCFLARELPMPLLLRLWDTYLAVGVDAVLPLHVSVCAALVFELRPQLLASRSSDEMMEVLKEPFKHVVMSSRRGDAHEQALQWMQELLARAYQLWRKYPDMASPSNS